MISSKRKMVPAMIAAAAGFGLSSMAAFGQAQPTQAELLDQVRTLQSRIEQLETKQTATAAKVDSAMVDKAVADVMADADKRSQMLQAGGFTAGYSGGKFLIQSEDGAFSMNPNIQFQARYVANYREDSKNGKATENDTQAGFEYRRLKFTLEGNVFSKDTTYVFKWATNRKSGALELEEGWAQHHFKDTPFSVRVGQFIDPYAHEQNVSSKRQLAVDRSLLNEVISTGGVGSEWFVQGIMLTFDDGGPLRANLAYTDGPNSRNTNFQDGAGVPAANLAVVNYGVSGRVEYKLMGNWKQYDDFTAMKNTEDLLVVGVGASFTEGDNQKALFHTADIQWEPQMVPGLSVYAAYNGIYRDFRTVGTGITGTPYDWGFLVQAGYMLDSQWEVFGRYDHISLDDKAPTGTGSLGAAARVSDSVDEITVGVNYYLKGHASKITADFTYLPNGSPLTQDGVDILSQPNDKAQFLVRVQYQLLL